MSRSPNAEQKLAIDHQGGIILSAGAGSGKTFVLVEHIVHLTQCWIGEYKSNSDKPFEEFIRGKFSEVVMMTFTKKAAGEMSIRLADKFLELSIKGKEDQEYWKMANDSISSLMVTTIDGFCRKLITSGFFPDLSTEAKIIFAAERKDQVCHFVEEWFSLNENRIDENVLAVILKEKNKMLDAYCEIFADPALRIQWRNFSEENCSQKEVETYIFKSFELNNLDECLASFSNLELPAEKDQSPFESMMFKLLSLGDAPIASYERLIQFYNILSSSKLNPQQGKKKCPEYDTAHEQRKILAKWVKEWYSTISIFFEHFEEKVVPWMKTLKEIFEYVDSRLDPNQGMTFGDIEYFVSKGLEREDILQRVLKQYRYYIVDEFQDTSLLQFNIITKLVNNNYQNLFCVGDPKQAIYGFRGGSLEVFRTARDILNNKSLANNYRSLPGIIKFNNSLFKTLFPLGFNYQGDDPYTVLFEDQFVPLEMDHKEVGRIEALCLKIDPPETDEEEKFELITDDVNRLEAKIIALDIKTHRDQHPSDVCTILYSTLKPSNDLIKNLIEFQIGFTAQYKIDLLEEPIIGIFVILLKRKFNTRAENKEHFPRTLIDLYFSILEVEVTIDERLFEEFDLSIEYWGLVEGFRKFLFKLGVTNENADINLDVIETISLLYAQDEEGVLTQIIQGTNDRLSLDLRFGENSQYVQIMSTHASKGLEFETVYLGGIYSNGKIKNDGTLLGELAGSFKWYLDISQKESFISPNYLYENERQKLLDFSEFKRLFYVACTRAQRNIKFVKLDFGKAFTPPKNSWISAIENWMSHPHFNEVNDFFYHKEIQLDPFSVFGSDSSAKLPLFFYDPMGLHKKSGQNAELLLAAELSVTRLNSLVDCPRKYYLENILKITPSEKTNVRSLLPIESEMEEVGQVVSSSERGTYIHAQIAEGIERNFIVPLESFNSNHKKPLQWILDELKNYQNDFEFIAEKPLKFRFFNFMISGIPDLILLSNSDKETQIWDYKTGKITESNLAHYWIQLQTYAYALYVLKKVDISSKVILKLAFVDKETILEKVVTFVECSDELFPLWSLQKSPWKINPDHCTQCSYGDICPR